MSDVKVLGSGKWLKLVEREFVDNAGKTQTWEFATRPSETRTVCLIAVKRDGAPSLVLVKQYRVPLSAWIVEFPAGLIDPGESPAEAALRELAEETGYIGEVVSAGPFTYNSPGMTDECVACVRIVVTGRGERALSNDEVIEVLEIPLEGLLDTLRSLEAAGTRIDAKLWFFAEALNLG